MILPIERQPIIFQMLQFKMQYHTTMSKVIGLQNYPDLLLQQFRQFTLVQSSSMFQSFKTFMTFIQKVIQNFCSCKECHNLKFLSEKPSRCCFLQTRHSFHVQALIHMQMLWKCSLFGRIWPNLQFLMSYRFSINLQEIWTSRDLKMFPFRAFVIQKQIRKDIPWNIELFQRSFKLLISEMFQNFSKERRK